MTPTGPGSGARRIVVLGCAGAGKTTFARRLANRIGAPHLCLDDLWGRPLRPEDVPAFRTLIGELHDSECWVSDGNFARASFDLRLPRADLAIWLERPRLVCAFRAVRRTLRPGEAHTIAGLPDALRFIWGFDRRNRPLIESTLKQIAPDLAVARANSPRQVEALLDSWKSPLSD